MKKINNLKEVMIILIAVIIITMSSTVFATGLVAGENTTTQIGSGEYENALTPDVENNAATENNAVTNNMITNNSSGNNVKKYNTTNTVMPQTGIEDYNIGILLIICVASAIFAYKKVSDYKNI